MKRVLITGGAGFVGSSLALRFRRAWPSSDVLALDNLHRRGSELNVPRLTREGVRFVRADVREPAAFDLPACDLIVDAAAEPSVLAGREGDADYVVRTNLVGTLNALETARRWRAAFLFLSTSRVYPIQALREIRLAETPARFEIEERQTLPGIGPQGVSEAFPLAGSRTLYGATKLASEVMVTEYAAQFGLPTLVNRCGVLAGPWQMGKVDQGVFALWIAAHHYGRPLTYLGYGGRQVRDVLHVEDLADLVLRQAAEPARWRGEVLAVGGGAARSVSLRELTALSQRATGRSVPLAESPETRWGDVPYYVTDATRAGREWDWRPARSLDATAADVSEWIRQNEDALRPVFGASVRGGER
jgi:CDP-paratose 2-epimerase